MSTITDITRVAVVEPHSLVRRGLESLLSSTARMRLVATATDPSDLPDISGQHLDVIIYGAPAPDRQQLTDVVGTLAECGRVLLLSDLAGWQLVADALSAGAFGCVSRQADDDQLLHAVRTVVEGGVYVAPGLAARLHTELRQRTAELPTQVLPPRELEALRWLARGLTHSQIARQMGLTEATVSTYVKRIGAKLHGGNKADLTRKAIEMGLLTDEPANLAELPPTG